MIDKKNYILITKNINFFVNIVFFTFLISFINGCEDYKVISPLDNSIGWVNAVQIKGTSFQHPITREKCEKKEG
jgi:hypothetical protein